MMTVTALLTDSGENPDCALLTPSRRGRCASVAGGGQRAPYWGLGWDGQAVRRVVAGEIGTATMAVEKETELCALRWVQGGGFSGVASSSLEGVGVARVRPGTLGRVTSGRAEWRGDISHDTWQSSEDGDCQVGRPVCTVPALTVLFDFSKLTPICQGLKYIFLNSKNFK
jgi:hypothetical protein